jgi:hypothetical protein
MKACYLALLAGAALFVGAPAARATTLFSEDFESPSGLEDGAWSRITSAAFWSDGGDPGHALSFSSSGQAGQIWSRGIDVAPAGTYVLSFDYRTDPSDASGKGAYAGYALSAGSDPGSNWLAGPDTGLTADGMWHHAEIAFMVSSSTSRIFLTFEDFIGSGSFDSRPHKAFFDNIVLTDGAAAAVPEPGALPALAVGALAAAARRRGRGAR